MANVFDRILEISPFEAEKRSKVSLEWFREKASNRRLSADSILNGKDYTNNRSNAPIIGSMFLFQYDAKYKETLPYWDMFPLVFPIEMDSKGFLGINLHYLPPTLRASLFDGLTRFKSKTASKDLAINYQILTKYSSLSYFKPCVKRYLYGHVRSKFMYIEPEEWPIAIFLPLQKFQKASAGKVYADSRKSLGIKRKYQ
jgi:hypothetical protein